MRLYLAGLETALSSGIEIPSNCYCLTSFYYCTDAIIQKLIERVGRENILLDSGAFTFQKHGLKGEDIYKYTDRYIEFINKWDLKYFFEMDIDMREEDLPLVLQLRKKIEEGTGKKCIPVWHETRGISHWKDLVKNYSYIAIGGITSGLKADYTEVVKDMVTYANRHGVKVHGLGYTRAGFINKGFYSVDSTSWIGYKYGEVWELRDGVPKMYKKKNKESKLDNKQYISIMRHSFYVWYKYQQSVRKRGFWHET